MTKNSKKTTVNALLNKKISQLTLEEIAQLEKALGTGTRPFPMWGPQRVEQDGSSDIEVGLSAIASDSHPMRVFSERTYEEVAALAYADMPVPSMLDLFMEALERRADPIMRQKDILEGRTPQNENFNRTQMLLGDPGHGKSFMGALMGRLRSTGSVDPHPARDAAPRRTTAAPPTRKEPRRLLGRARMLNPRRSDTVRTLPGASAELRSALVVKDTKLVDPHSGRHRSNARRENRSPASADLSCDGELEIEPWQQYSYKSGWQAAMASTDGPFA